MVFIQQTPLLYVEGVPTTILFTQEFQNSVGVVTTMMYVVQENDSAFWEVWVTPHPRCAARTVSSDGVCALTPAMYGM